LCALKLKHRPDINPGITPDTGDQQCDQYYGQSVVDYFFHISGF